MQKYYATAAKSVIDEFENTYNHLLASIEEGREATPADLYKLEKYWEMQGKLRQSLNKLGEKEIEMLTRIFESSYSDIYNGLDLPSDLKFSGISKDTAHHLINSVWCADGKSWSSRVWDNTGKLAETLNDELINTLLTGKKTTDLKTKLQESFSTSYSEANRLVRTELAHIQTAAEQRYKDSGIEYVEVWADKDERQCEVCGKLHQKKYRIGETIPIPAHPNCRCCIVPVVEQNGNLDMVVDEFVPCLKDAKTGEILPTVVEHIDTKALKGYNKSNGWCVNWQQLSRQGYDVQAVKLKGSEEIEGLIALKSDDTAKAIYVDWIVSAPHNNPAHGNKKYIGVGGHLFAIAAEEALQKFNGNMYAFAANKELVNYYTKELFAEYIGILHDFHIVWDAEGCKNLLEAYNYERL